MDRADHGVRIGSFKQTVFLVEVENSVMIDFSKKIPLALVLLASSIGPANAAVIAYHDDASALGDAISQSQFEDFEDAALLAGLSISGTGNVSGGVLYRLVRPDRASVFSFAEGVFGLGGMIRAGGFGSLELTLTFEDGSQEMLDPFNVGPSKRYLGFTSDLGIRSVSVKSAGAGAVQFYLDDLTFGQALATSAVPEPAAWALMIVGFAAVGSSMRRRSHTMQTSFV